MRGKAGDLLSQRRAEQHGLALLFCGRAVDDLSHIRDKTHVEHPISLVDDQHLDLFQVYLVAPLKVEQPSGRCYDDIYRSSGQLLSLLCVIHAAEDGNGFQGTVLGELASFLGDLEHQLPGGCQDKDTGRARFSFFLDGIVQYPGDNGDQEGSRLSRTGLGPAACILAGQAAGKDFSLDWRTVLEAKIVNGMQQGGWKIKIVKPHLPFRGRDLEP